MTQIVLSGEESLQEKEIVHVRMRGIQIARHSCCSKSLDQQLSHM